LSWNLTAPELFFESQDEDEDEEQVLPGFTNSANATVVPVEGSVLKGAGPVRVDSTLSYVIFRDTSTGASLPFNSGWLLASSNTILDEAQTNATSFVEAANEVAVEFTWSRGNTYLLIEVQNSGTLGVLLGSIFGWGATVIAVFVIIGKALEWTFFKCGKRRARAVSFFMDHYEKGGDIETRVGAGENYCTETQMQAPESVAFEKSSVDL
jgi:hypothetical protein